MTRFEEMMSVTLEQLAESAVRGGITDAYCKGDCGDEDCTHELECCIKWLNEEVKENEME